MSSAPSGRDGGCSACEAVAHTLPSSRAVFLQSWALLLSSRLPGQFSLPLTLHKGFASRWLLYA